MFNLQSYLMCVCLSSFFCEHAAFTPLYRGHSFRRLYAYYASGKNQMGNTEYFESQAVRNMKVAVVGGGFAGLATAYNLVCLGANVTVFDKHSPGEGGASSVAAGMLHPLTPRGKLIWRGEEGLKDAMNHISAANSALESTGSLPASGSIITSKCIIKPIFDEKQLRNFEEIALKQPNLFELLSKLELQSCLPGASNEVLGGIRICGGVVIDSRSYLKGLWKACLLESDTAKWIESCLTADSINELTSDGKFDAVAIAIGADMKGFPGLKDIKGIKLIRGHCVIFEDQEPYLNAAFLNGDYVVPTLYNGRNALAIGATKEHILYSKIAEQPDEELLKESCSNLEKNISGFYPKVSTLNKLETTHGVRVIRDRGKGGRLPIVDRVPQGNSKNYWFAAALGSRGLIHHALIGKYLARAVYDNDENRIPSELRITSPDQFVLT